MLKFKKARKYLASLYLSIFSIINISYADENYITPKTYSIDFSYGIAYLNQNENIYFPTLNTDNYYLENSNFNYFNFSFATNNLPYISLQGLLIYSLNINYSTNYFNPHSYFKYSSYDLNLSFYESFIKSFTVHPTLGIGFVQITLAPKENLNSLNFNFGGGFDIRYLIYDDENYNYFLLQSLDLNYSIMLTNLYKTINYDYNSSTFQIKFSISLELQKKGKVN